MIKKIFIALAAVLVIIYLGLAVTAFNVKPEGLVCKGIDLVITDSVNAGFFTDQELDGILKRAKIYPVGLPMELVDADSIEKVVGRYYLVDQVECYKTTGQKVVVEVSQRVPILRVMAQNGDNYYIDNRGKLLPAETKCLAYLPVVTGHVDKPFAQKELYDFAQYLQKNEFWNAQIEQIHVLPRHELELVPRVGNHIIFLGTLHNYQQKLDHLFMFYKDALNTVGWNKYSRINLDFENQIVGTKKKN